MTRSPIRLCGVWSSPGAARAFIAGADIAFFVANIEAGALDRTVAFTRRGHELLAAIAASTKPVVARVQGLTLGGGLEVALACHAILATPDASFAFPETGIGIYPGLGGTQRTPRRVGKGLAKWLVFTGERLDAARAHAIGLIDQVVDPAEMDAAIAAAIGNPGSVRRRGTDPPVEFSELAALFDAYPVDSLLSDGNRQGKGPVASAAVKALASKAPVALRVAEELIDAGAGLPLDRALELELERLTEIFSTRDAYEGLTSIGSRQPQFVGG